MVGKILVLGATGTVGRPLVRALRAAGAEVRAASRGGEPVEGAPGVRLDLDDPSGFDAAFEGIDAAYLVMPSGRTDVTDRLLPVVALAAERGVKLVMQSVLGADADDAIPYRQVELALERSGTRFVILRPNWFADNFHTFWKQGIAAGVIALPAADGKTSFIDARDIAESAAAALTGDRFDGQAFNLTGPEALSYAEAAVLLSEAVGKPILYQPVEDAAFVAMLTGAGLSADYAGVLAAIFHSVREGWAAGVTDAVRTLTGKAPRTLATYAVDHAAVLRG